MAAERMFSEDVARFYLAELLLALEHLHALGIVYRDLKPENCLLDEAGHVLLTDFGLSKVSIEGSRTNTVCGTAEYMAPEILLKVNYDKSVDLWTFGILMYEMLTGDTPFRSSNKKKTLDAILKKKLQIPYYISADAKDLLIRLLRKNPNVRLGSEKDGIEKIKSHRFFRKINWKELAQRTCTPPIRPIVTDPALAENFDDQFTKEIIKESPIDGPNLDEKMKDYFLNFSYSYELFNVFMLRNIHFQFTGNFQNLQLSKRKYALSKPKRECDCELDLPLLRGLLGRLLPVATQCRSLPATQRFASSAATTTRFFKPNNNNTADDILQFREKPESLSYFTGNYKYNDLLIELNTLYKQFEDWKPVVNDASLPSDFIQQESSEKVYAWKLRDKMSELLSIPLTTSQWRKITIHLNALASLPKPLPAPVAHILAPYERHHIAQNKEIKVRSLDEYGRAYAVGRRKESSARCYLVEGEGKILVNGVELDSYFQRPVDRDEVTLPLEVTETKDKFNAWVVVTGGGSTGQAQAIKLGLGRALLVHDAELKQTLRKAGCITRDPRVVERKKEGQRKARAKYTWVKR
ncbi:hypothetical protein G6F59_006585 [Rhizopus arrhizus]|nr:hypothetical protein G6F59_006585 [Rhizopus arrhizus]